MNGPWYSGDTMHSARVMYFPVILRRHSSQTISWTFFGAEQQLLERCISDLAGVNTQTLQ